MKEVFGDLWTYPVPADKIKVICITTNGSVRKDGCAVMGRGCAKQAADRYPALAKTLGGYILREGNHPYFFNMLDSSGYELRTFPVKRMWSQRANLILILHSVVNLSVVAYHSPHRIFLLPRPGCGNGGLRWRDVEPLIRDLPDNVWVITNGLDPR